MARPIKKGLDYFPLNTDFMNNRTIRRLKRKGGFKAIVLYMDLLCDIYANSYFIEITDNYIFDLSDQLGLEEKDIRSMIEIMIELGLFHEESFNKSHILTSETIQEQYAFSKSKRSDNKAIVELHKIVNEVKNRVSADETQQNYTESAYSIVKDSKVNSERECAPTHPREEWNVWIEELLADEEWRAAAVRQSGEGVSFNSRLPRLLSDFCDYLVSSGETGTIGQKADLARRFHYWWQYHGRKRAQTDRPGKNTQKAPSRIEEINRVGDESLALARQMMLKDGIRA